MLAGRDFTPADTPTSPRVAIVNQAFARKFFAAPILWAESSMMQEILKPPGRSWAW